MADNHTYFVGKRGVFVHNECDPRTKECEDYRYGGNPPGVDDVLESSLPKSPTGKGAVPSSQRDPKRVWTKKEKSNALGQRNGKCDGCGNDIGVDDAQGHHITRHADGGSTTDDNLAILCDPCHKDIHRK